ncbi:LytR/AlgR family response regulator transcription factor [Flagellimonas lutaonensis]|uniref:Response regulator receiver protein n=1 Tax=Flagellimonas lutaonensis TaxID=516051 RepID=A0A0D5YXC0_9FLAO|nr:LytTR family DNA-binding domain-containing protein [Allomuricauda lutaonensis]AKA36503.1 Response regulator receiver protein [Allomuricauda lutaonensis]
MRKDKLYFLTFLSIAVIYTVIASVALHYLIRASAHELLEAHLQFSKKEAKTFGTLVSHQLASGIAKDSAVTHIQRSLKGTDFEMGFLSMYDWSGRVVCHPDINKVGQQASNNASFVTSVTDDLSPETFYDLLVERQKKLENNVSEGIEQVSEVIHLYPVQNSDWIVAAHVNIGNISLQLSEIRKRFYTIFLVMGLVVILSYAITVRLIGSAYEKRLELKNQKLEDEVINLSKLNRAVGAYQQKVIEKKPASTTKSAATKKRILTYVRNELLPVPIEEIAHIYTENTITYVVCFNERRSTTNLSLDELFSNLDSSYFFRANRQFIIAISAIDKIVRYGNNQLKILVNPNSEVDIIISKNRAAEFKQWLNL